MVIIYLLVKSFLLLHGVSPKRQNLFNLRGPVLEKLDMEVESPWLIIINPFTVLGKPLLRSTHVSTLPLWGFSKQRSLFRRGWGQGSQDIGNETPIPWLCLWNPRYDQQAQSCWMRWHGRMGVRVEIIVCGVELYLCVRNFKRTATIMQGLLITILFFSGQHQHFPFLKNSIICWPTFVFGDQPLFLRLSFLPFSI